MVTGKQLCRCCTVCMLHLLWIHYSWSFSFKWKQPLYSFFVQSSAHFCFWTCTAVLYFPVMYVNTFKQQLCYNYNNVTASRWIKEARKKQWQGLLGWFRGAWHLALWGFDYAPVADGWGNLVLPKQSSLPPKQRQAWRGTCNCCHR